MANPIPEGGDDAAEDPAAGAAIRRYEERLAGIPASLAFAPLADPIARPDGRARPSALCREGLGALPALHDGAADPGQGARWTTATPTARWPRCGVILEASPTDAQAHRLAAEIHRRAGRLATRRGQHLRAGGRARPGRPRVARCCSRCSAAAGRAGEGSALGARPGRRHVRRRELRRALPRAGAGRRGGADLPAPPPEGSGRHAGPRAARRGAPGQDTATERVITRCRCPRRSSRRG